MTRYNETRQKSGINARFSVLFIFPLIVILTKKAVLFLSKKPLNFGLTVILAYRVHYKQKIKANQARPVNAI
mgnify:CR=1 FL=1